MGMSTGASDQMCPQLQGHKLKQVEVKRVGKVVRSYESCSVQRSLLEDSLLRDVVFPMRSGYLKRGSTAESFCFSYSACHLHPLGYNHLVTFPWISVWCV
jgi:hypothetical protein